MLRPPPALFAALAGLAAWAGCTEPGAGDGRPETTSTVLPADSAVADSSTASEPAPLAPDTVDVQGVRRARAQIQPVGEGRAEGAVTMTQLDGGVRVQAQLDGLSREQYHALQVLRGRDCGADPSVHLGAESGARHGGPYAPPGSRHAGDLGSVRGDDRVGRYDRIDPALSLSGTGSPVGRAVVVRALRDDAASADGAAGPVIGCGVLEPS